MPNMVIGSRRIVGDGVANLDDSDKVRIQEQVEALEGLDIPEGYVLLLSPLYPELEFGPFGTSEYRDPMSGNIKFVGGTWSGPAGHERLPDLMKAHREIVELRPMAAPAKTYACPDCEQEFDTKAKLAAHQKAAHKE